VVAVVKDLFFVARIRETARMVGVPVVFARTPAEVEHALSRPSRFALVDLTSDLDYEASLRDRRAEVPVLAFTTHALARHAARHGRCRRNRYQETLTPGSGCSGRTGVNAEVRGRLAAENQELLERLAPEATLKPEVEGDLTVVNLLKVALKNEIEATEIAARWLVTTEELPVKLALARQVGDEARHYRLIADRLKALGFAATSFDPLVKGYGPLFNYLALRDTWAGRVNSSREAIAIVRPTVHRVLRGGR
jgi:hypothetical protein